MQITLAIAGDEAVAPFATPVQCKLSLYHNGGCLEECGLDLLRSKSRFEALVLLLLAVFGRKQLLSCLESTKECQFMG